jgi:hydroxymethylpyrimidine pyrophosphatase-like HAD family hydrolase
MENQYSPGWYWLTVYNSQATKDKAIGALIESRGLKGSELVVFGDNINDLKMFQFADRAIAVGNAQPEAIRHADQVIGSNAEDAVVRYIQADWRKS